MHCVLVCVWHCVIPDAWMDVLPSFRRSTGPRRMNSFWSSWHLVMQCHVPPDRHYLYVFHSYVCCTNKCTCKSIYIAIIILLCAYMFRSFTDHPQGLHQQYVLKMCSDPYRDWSLPHRPTGYSIPFDNRYVPVLTTVLSWYLNYTEYNTDYINFVLHYITGFFNISSFYLICLEQRGAQLYGVLIQTLIVWTTAHF